MKQILLILITLHSISVFAQKGAYVRKEFLATKDAAICNRERVSNNKSNVLRMCSVQKITIHDIDTENKPLYFNDSCLVAIEGPAGEHGEINGIMSTYIFSKKVPRERYLVATQEYKNGKLDGKYKVFYLNGTLASLIEARGNKKYVQIDYDSDGKTLINKKVYNHKDNTWSHLEYENGILSVEKKYLKDSLITAIEYYTSGKRKMYCEYENGEPHGIYQYYHDNGQVWIELEYKNGKFWNAIANYDRDGKSKDVGTLKNGNGTIKYYNTDGTIRDVATVVNGEKH